jgi:hypothetical protein
MMGVRIGTVSHSTQIEITYDLLVSFSSGTFHHLSFIFVDVINSNAELYFFVCYYDGVGNQLKLHYIAYVHHK